MRIKGAQIGINASDDAKRPVLARPMSIAAIQHACIAPSRYGRRNSPILEIVGSSGANIDSLSRCNAVETPLGSSLLCLGCLGKVSIPDTWSLSSQRHM